MLNIGTGEWVLIFLVILLLFGAKRIPEMAKGLGKGIREFRKAMSEVQEEIDVNKTSPPVTRQAPAPQGALSQGSSPSPAATVPAETSASTPAPPPPPIA
jgi:sec-independent protein translocase protein TatA